MVKLQGNKGTSQQERIKQHIEQQDNTDRESNQHRQTNTTHPNSTANIKQEHTKRHTTNQKGDRKIIQPISNKEIAKQYNVLAV